jgi:iron complex outermembrane receptor protein
VSLLAFATSASAEDTEREREIVVVADVPGTAIDNAPSTKVTVSQERIATTINAVSVEDTLKYVPSLVIRKRHIGDNFAPIATRTSGLGSSARSLIYADGVLLSALIANNNGNGSPRWNMVTPEEVALVDVLYGPFSAAYSGNSIGTVVNITTRMPDKLEARATVLTNVQQYSLYGQDQTLPTWQVSGSIGDRFGPLAVSLSGTRTSANSQPVSYVTAPTAPAGTTGAVGDLSKLGVPVKVLGTGGVEHHVQDTGKLKAALDLGPTTRLTYVLGLWRDDSRGTAETFLRNAAGPVFTSAFSSGVYSRDALHWSHALSAEGTGKVFDWQVTGTLYRYGRDIQRTPTATLPAAFTSGAGNVVRQDGTGWFTLDAKGLWRAGVQTISFGAHIDQYRINSNRYGTADWTSDQQGALNQASRGKTRTAALWAQDAVRITPQVTLTLGVRYEWWRAFDGLNFSTSPALNAVQPERRAHGLSPKATLEWRPAPAWSARLSLGQAYRFPTAGELYQAVTTGPVLSVPDSNLKPERARSGELAIEHGGAHGSVRLSLFDEVITNALISQSGALPPALGVFTYVQNVDRTRARGAELAIDRRDVVRDLDLSASVTYADAITSANATFPAAVGKLLPSVPHWKANAVVTWHPTDRIALTTAARYASRNYANLDNSDTVGNTYQGFYKYFVVDARATFKVTERFDFAVGVDNLGNDRYFLFHPFPQRSFTAQVNWKL